MRNGRWSGTAVRRDYCPNTAYKWPIVAFGHRAAVSAIPHTLRILVALLSAGFPGVFGKRAVQMSVKVRAKCGAMRKCVVIMIPGLKPPRHEVVKESRMGPPKVK